MSQLITLLEWNYWANSKYRELLDNKCTYEELTVETPYGLLLDRIVHIFASYDMWISRMKGDSPQSVLTSDNFQSLRELLDYWKASELRLLEFARNADISKIVSYTSLDGKKYTRSVESILFHLTSHPNYHRGQVSAVFKFLELPAFPSTDMVIYFLETR